MQDKYTPGPWEAMGTWVRSPMHQPEGLPRGVQIAECWDGYFLPHTPEAKANARLIATAPELLEEIEREYTELSDFQNEWHGRNTEAGQAKLYRLRALIAKATGRDEQDVQDDYGTRKHRAAKAAGSTL